MPPLSALLGRPQDDIGRAIEKLGETVIAPRQSEKTEGLLSRSLRLGQGGPHRGAALHDRPVDEPSGRFGREKRPGTH